MHGVPCFVPLVSGARLRLGARIIEKFKQSQQPQKTSVKHSLFEGLAVAVLMPLAPDARPDDAPLDKLLVSNHEKTIVLYCFLHSYVMEHVRFSRVLLGFLRVTSE